MQWGRIHKYQEQGLPMFKKTSGTLAGFVIKLISRTIWGEVREFIFLFMDAGSGITLIWKKQSFRRYFKVLEHTCGWVLWEYFRLSGRRAGTWENWITEEPVKISIIEKNNNSLLRMCWHETWIETGLTGEDTKDTHWRKILNNLHCWKKGIGLDKGKDSQKVVFTNVYRSRA